MGPKEALMTITVEATYENGVLKPDAPLKLQEKAKVRLTIEEPHVAQPEDDDPTGWKAIDRLMGIGKAVAPDVSEKHDDHLYGDPRD
jgi:predicted DNA-binding antitoxin AbrB/MazE fold protein